MTIVIKAEYSPGEEITKMSEITVGEMEVLEPLIDRIYNNSGYFPTGSKYNLGEPSIEELYGDCIGIVDFMTRIPDDRDIEKITEIHVFREEPISLYM